MLSSSSSFYEDLKSIIGTNKDLSVAEIQFIRKRINGWKNAEIKENLPTEAELKELSELIANNFAAGYEQRRLQFLIGRMQDYRKNPSKGGLTEALNLKDLTPTSKPSATQPPQPTASATLYQELKSYIEDKQDFSTAQIQYIRKRINGWKNAEIKENLPTEAELKELSELIANNFAAGYEQRRLQFLIGRMQDYRKNPSKGGLTEALNLKDLTPTSKPSATQPQQPTAPTNSILRQAAQDIDTLYKQQKVSVGFSSQIAHRFFTNKQRPHQIEIVKALLEQWNTNPKTISPEALYGGLSAVQQSIGKTNYDSRLNSLLTKLMQDPDITGTSPEQGKNALNSHLLGSPGSLKSMLDTNPVLKAIRAGIQKNEPMRQATNESGITLHTNLQAAKQWIQDPDRNNVNDLYKKARGIKSLIKQNPQRPQQIEELQKVIDNLKTQALNQENMLTLVGCLLKIEAATPSQSGLRKVVNKMFSDMNINPATISERDKVRAQNAYNDFMQPKRDLRPRAPKP